MPDNQREFTRIRTAIHVDLGIGGNEVVHGILDNISFNGLLLKNDASLPEQTPCLIRIRLEGGGGGPVIEASGKVVRTGQGKMAVQFTELLGRNSVEHLRNLVLYNSGAQADQVEEEFRRHLGLKPIS